MHFAANQQNSQSFGSLVYRDSVRSGCQMSPVRMTPNLSLWYQTSCSKEVSDMMAFPSSNELGYKTRNTYFDDTCDDVLLKWKQWKIQSPFHRFRHHMVSA